MEGEGKDGKSSFKVSNTLREDKTLNGKTVCVTLCKFSLPSFPQL